MQISGDRIQIQDYFNILFKNEKVKINPDIMENVGRCHDFLVDFSVDKVIYGVNTGLGPMAQYRIEPEDQVRLQYNLIRSHASGSGSPLDVIYVKAAMISRLKSLSLGYSGIHPDAIQLLQTLINENVIPFIPEHGGVGASGDLIQLSHIALVLIGEGEVYYQGKWQSAAQVFDQLSIKPLKIHLREGLGLINGTSVMSGIGIVNTIRARQLMNWSVINSCLINEIVQSFDDHFSSELNSTKQHNGQHRIAKAMRKVLADSSLIEKRADHLYNGKIEEKIFKQKIQEYYSLRCVPQVLGPVCDAIRYAESVLSDEVNSANDNPIVDMETKTVYHGGNFHGDYVAFEMDKLKTGITKLSMLAERQINFLMNNKLNEVLPPFVNLGTLGLNLGMQGAQFGAVSTVAENQTLSNPVYIHSIPNNNDNQDIVSMGTNAALMAGKVIDNTFEVLAVECLSIIQAIDHLGIQDKLATQTKMIYTKLREIVPVFTDDHPKYQELSRIKQLLMTFNPEIIE